MIRDLSLRNFRNYESAHLEFRPGLNMILGENAQGKTNLLESLVYLSLTRSFRLNDDTKAIREGQEFADIRCTADQQKLEIILHKKGKTLLVNKVPVKRSSEFIGKLNVVLFTPDDLGIFADAPRERRKMLNQEITKISGTYLAALNHLQNLLKDRNTLLKTPTPDPIYLDTLDQKLCEYSLPIIQERKKFIEQINLTLNEEFHEISGMEEKAEVIYNCCVEEPDIPHIAEMLKNSRERDIESRMTNTGIHREDITFMLDGKNVIYHASQGQKRMILLAFKLALLSYVEKETGHQAVLLLDDVLSELDPQRQRRLLKRIERTEQCLITAAEIPQHLDTGRISTYRIHDGKTEVSV